MRSIIVLLLLAVCATFAFAATDVNVTSPASSSVITGSTFLNSTIVKPTVNVTFQVQSASTATSSWTTVCRNLTANGTGCTWDTTGVEDASDYIIRAYSNDNTSQIGNTVSSITIDNTVPTAPSSLTSGEQSANTGTVTLTGTVVNAETTTCSVTFGANGFPTSSVPSASYSASTCTVTLNNPSEGDYTYTLTASDGTNTTASSSVAISIREGGSNAAPGGAVVQGIADNTLSVIGNNEVVVNTASQGIIAEVKEEFTRSELKKTGIGALIGGGIGMAGIALGPLGAITVPAGAVIGGLIGAYL